MSDAVPAIQNWKGLRCYLTNKTNFTSHSVAQSSVVLSELIPRRQSRLCRQPRHDLDDLHYLAGHLRTSIFAQQLCTAVQALPRRMDARGLKKEITLSVL